MRRRYVAAALITVCTTLSPWPRVDTPVALAPERSLCACCRSDKDCGKNEHCKDCVCTAVAVGSGCAERLDQLEQRMEAVEGRLRLIDLVWSTR